MLLREALQQTQNSAPRGSSLGQVPPSTARPVCVGPAAPCPGTASRRTQSQQPTGLPFRDSPESCAAETEREMQAPGTAAWRLVSLLRDCHPLAPAAPLPLLLLLPGSSGQEGKGLLEKPAHSGEFSSCDSNYRFKEQPVGSVTGARPLPVSKDVSHSTLTCSFCRVTHSDAPLGVGPPRPPRLRPAGSRPRGSASGPACSPGTNSDSVGLALCGKRTVGGRE